MSKPPITDAPWFWLLVFSTTAFIALVAIGPKYGRRQQGVERRFEARRETARQVHERKASGADDFHPPTLEPGQHLRVPLWGLFGSVGVVMLYSGWQLYRWRQAHKGVDSH
jgi:hypothetical protein